MNQMKRIVAFLILIFLPHLIFASFDNFIIRIGNFKLTARYHFVHGHLSGCDEYSAYWDLINLVSANAADFQAVEADINLLISFSTETSRVSAYVEQGAEYLNHVTSYSSDTIKDLIHSIAGNLQENLDLKSPTDNEIFFHRFIIPLEQDFYNIQENYDLIQYSNLYIGANSGETFWGVYDLIVFERKLFADLLEIIEPLNYSHYHYGFNHQSINALQNVSFLER